jgi:DNA-binding PadR family transcriptional regulator
MCGASCEAERWPFLWMAGPKLGPFGRHGFRHHGPPPWFMHAFGGPPPRAERGEVRYLVLDVLVERPRHGYEVIQAIEERCGGAYRPSPGTIYPTLQMLDEMGQVRSREVDGRKIYELTDEGRQELEAHREEVSDAYERFGGKAEPWADPEQLHELGARVHKVVRAMGAAFRRGTLSARRWREVQKAISEAADRIEQILDGR